jgi:hypothetical protein
MWEPRRLTTLWAFTACYRDSFTLYLSIIASSSDVVIRYIIIGKLLDSVLSIWWNPKSVYGRSCETHRTFLLSGCPFKDVLNKIISNPFATTYLCQPINRQLCIDIKMWHWTILTLRSATVIEVRQPTNAISPGLAELLQRSFFGRKE